MIAIISDIHSNKHALTKVRDDADYRNVTGYWMLGDAIGYGPDPVNVLEILHGLSIEEGAWLAGNHDWAGVRLHYPDRGISPDFNNMALRALKQNYDILKKCEATKGYLDKLSKLPIQTKIRPNIYLTHGGYVPDEVHQTFFSEEKEAHYSVRRYTETLLDVEELLYANQDEWLPLTTNQPVVQFSGHRHLPHIFERKADAPAPRDVYGEDIRRIKTQMQTYEGHWIKHPITYNQWFSLSNNTLYSINVGSVGFPRDKKHPCPTYVLFDESDGEQRIQFRRVTYDIPAAREWMKNLETESDIYEKYLLDCSG